MSGEAFADSSLLTVGVANITLLSHTRADSATGHSIIVLIYARCITCVDYPRKLDRTVLFNVRHKR
jgi:hypothetical protein